MKLLLRVLFSLFLFNFVYTIEVNFLVEGLYNTADMKEFNDFIEKQRNNITTPLTNLGFTPSSSLKKVNQFSGFEVGLVLPQNEKFSFMLSCDYIISNNCGWSVNSSGVWLVVPYEYDIKLNLKNYLTSIYGGVIYNFSLDAIKIKPAFLFGYGFGELKGNYKSYTKIGNQINNADKDIHASGENLVSKAKIFIEYLISTSISLNLSIGYRMATIPELKYTKDVDLNNDGQINSNDDLVLGESVKDRQTSDVIQFDYSGFFVSFGVLISF